MCERKWCEERNGVSIMIRIEKHSTRPVLFFYWGGGEMAVFTYNCVCV
jgi:hypothetical protein